MDVGETVPKTGKDPLSYVKHVENNLLLGNITEMEIVSIVNKMKARFSSGVDGISNDFLKKLCMQSNYLFVL